MNRIICFFTTLGIFMSGCARMPTTPTSPNFSALEPRHSELKQSLPLNRQLALEKLSQLSSVPVSTNKIQKKNQEFTITLPSTPPQLSHQNEWNYSYITVFSKTPEKVDQIAITTINCNAPIDITHQNEMRERMLYQIISVSRSLWGQEFKLNGENYFKELGPTSFKPLRIPIHETYEPVTKMYLAQGIYKCDGAGGYGLRYDFFPK